MKNNLSQTLVAILLVATAILLLNPFHFWMPDMLVVCTLVSALILFGIYASFILREKSFDERDSVHKTLAGRNAFITGSMVLIIGIAVQGYTHAVDIWLVVALIVMIFTKIGTRIWTDKNL